MKIYKITFVLLLLFVFTDLAKAQSYSVSETMTIIDGEYTRAMLVKLPEEADDIEDEWEDYLDDNYDLDLDKIRRKRDTTTYISKQVIRNNLNNVSYDIYSKIVENDNGTTDLYVKWAFNEDTFIEAVDNPQKAADVRYIMEKFAQKVYVEYYEEQLENLMDEREDVVDDYDDLKDDVKQLEKRNEKLKRKIKKYQEDIDSNKEQKEVNQTTMEKLEKTANSLENKIEKMQVELANIKG